MHAKRRAVPHPARWHRRRNGWVLLLATAVAFVVLILVAVVALRADEHGAASDARAWVTLPPLRIPSHTVAATRHPGEPSDHALEEMKRAIPPPMPYRLLKLEDPAGAVKLEPPELVTMDRYDPRRLPRDLPQPDPYNDSEDEVPARRGEVKLTLNDLKKCLAARLGVDLAGKRELPLVREQSIPYLVTPVTVELRDLKGFFCNLTTTVRHLMIVQNGEARSMTRFLDDLQRDLLFTSRLQILRYAYNAGYAGAVNAAMRDALRYSFEEVPFFFMSNCDIRFPPGLMEERLKAFYEATAGDAERMRQLEAEVATEPNEHTPAKFRDVPLRSNRTDTLLVTSRLLPDRIRYMKPAEMAKQFAGHYGALFLDREGGTATWAISRLSMETVGYMDENFYPVYYEDIDLRLRQEYLGYRVLTLPKGLKEVIHFSSSILRSAEEAPPMPRDVTAMTATMYHIMRQEVLPSRRYAHFKYIAASSYADFKPAFPWFPMDAWVWDRPRRLTIENILSETYSHFLVNPRAVRGHVFPWMSPAERALRLQQMVPNSDLLYSYVNGTELRTMVG